MRRDASPERDSCGRPAGCIKSAEWQIHGGNLDGGSGWGWLGGTDCCRKWHLVLEKYWIMNSASARAVIMSL